MASPDDCVRLRRGAPGRAEWIIAYSERICDVPIKDRRGREKARPRTRRAAACHGIGPCQVGIAVRCTLRQEATGALAPGRLTLAHSLPRQAPLHNGDGHSLPPTGT